MGGVFGADRRKGGEGRKVFFPSFSFLKENFQLPFAPSTPSPLLRVVCRVWGLGRREIRDLKYPSPPSSSSPLQAEREGRRVLSF